jgi:hypothetical protein
MMLIRGNTRVADIYMTEVDRIFRHFRARDIINHSAAIGQHKEWLLLDPTDEWIGQNFQEGSYKNNRRLLFFPDGQTRSWTVWARKDGDPFEDEDARVEEAKAKRNKAAKARRNVKTGKRKSASGSRTRKSARKTAATRVRSGRQTRNAGGRRRA